MGLNIPTGRSGGGGKFDFRKVLAWASFVIGFFGGSVIALTSVGGVVARVFGIAVWLPILVLIALTAMMVRDIGMDGEPNRWALWWALLTPTLCRSTGGQIAALITEWSGQVRVEGTAIMQGWFGAGGALLGIACCMVAMIWSKRAMKSG